MNEESEAAERLLHSELSSLSIGPEDDEPELVIDGQSSGSAIPYLFLGSFVSFAFSKVLALLLLAGGAFALIQWVRAGRTKFEFFRNGVRMSGKFWSQFIDYDRLDLSSEPAILKLLGLKTWKVSGTRLMWRFPESDLMGRPLEDLILRAFAAKGVPVAGPWGARESQEQPPAASTVWRQRGDTKWLFVLPAFFLFALAALFVKEGISDVSSALEWSIPSFLWLAAWLGYALLRPRGRGGLEFDDKGVKLTFRGQTLHEVDYSDLKMIQVQTQKLGGGSTRKRLVAVTHYAREIPLTDWRSRWDKSGDFVISQSLMRGLHIEISGLDQKEALPNE